MPAATSCTRRGISLHMGHSRAGVGWVYHRSDTADTGRFASECERPEGDCLSPDITVSCVVQPPPSAGHRGLWCATSSGERDCVPQASRLLDQLSHTNSHRRPAVENRSIPRRVGLTLPTLRACPVLIDSTLPPKDGATSVTRHARNSELSQNKLSQAAVLASIPRRETGVASPSNSEPD